MRIKGSHLLEYLEEQSRAVPYVALYLLPLPSLTLRADGLPDLDLERFYDISEIGRLASRGISSLGVDTERALSIWLAWNHGDRASAVEGVSFDESVETETSAAAAGSVRALHLVVVDFVRDSGGATGSQVLDHLRDAHGMSDRKKGYAIVGKARKAGLVEKTGDTWRIAGS